MTDNRKQIDILQTEIDRNHALISQNREKRDKTPSDRDVKKMEADLEAAEKNLDEIEKRAVEDTNKLLALEETGVEGVTQPFQIYSVLLPGGVSARVSYGALNDF